MEIDQQSSDSYLRMWEKEESVLARIMEQVTEVAVLGRSDIRGRLIQPSEEPGTRGGKTTCFLILSVTDPQVLTHWCA